RLTSGWEVPARVPVAAQDGTGWRPAPAWASTAAGGHDLLPWPRRTGLVPCGASPPPGFVHDPALSAGRAAPAAAAAGRPAPGRVRAVPVRRLHPGTGDGRPGLDRPAGGEGLVELGRTRGAAAAQARGQHGARRLARAGGRRCPAEG